MTTTENIIYLIQCSLSEKKPDENLLTQANFSQIFKICQKHKIAALTDISVQKLGSDIISDDMKKKFRNRTLNTQRTNILFEAEKENIFDMLEENKIWYLPLKGCVIKDCWEQPELREHADIDILFDNRYTDKVRSLMESMGYVTEDFGKNHHDTYLKKPVYNFEMHRTLFEARDETAYEYYKDIKNKLLPVNSKNYEYQFSNEDFYIYFIAHAVKHINNGGTGLRTLIDIYLYLENTPLDFDYIQNQLSLMNISNEESKLRKLSQKILSAEIPFSINLLDESEREFLDFIVSSGAYGTIEHLIQNRMSDISENKNYSFKNKFVYWCRRIFIVPPDYKTRYPHLYKNKFSRSFINIIRFANGLTSKRKDLIKEFKMVRKMKK